MGAGLSRRGYRRLLLAYVAVTAIDILAALAGLAGSHSPLLAAAYESEPSRLQHAPLPVLVLEIAVMSALMVGTSVGLYRFRHWGRVLGLWTSVLYLPWMAWNGPFLYTGIEAALANVEAVLWGALLALAWCGPLGSAFDPVRTPPVMGESAPHKA